jgi:non-specific serine/threonine protein kinase
LQLVNALYLFWYFRGQYREGLRWYDRGRAVAGAENPSARADVLKLGASLAFACREFPLARSLIGEALAVYRRLDDTPNTVRGLTLLGAIATNAGDDEEALARLEEGAALAREAGDDSMLSFALSNLGYAALATDLDRAYAASLESTELIRARPPEQRPLSTLGTALEGLGLAALLQGRLGEARTHLRESLAVRSEIRDVHGLVAAFTGVAALAAEDGEFSRAAPLLGAADALRERTDAELEPFMGALYERTAAAARERLSGEGFASAHEEGRKLPLEDAVAFALDFSGAPGTAGAAVTRPS